MTELERAIEHHNEPRILLRRFNQPDQDITNLVYLMMRGYKTSRDRLQRIRDELVDF